MTQLSAASPPGGRLVPLPIDESLRLLPIGVDGRELWGSIQVSRSSVRPITPTWITARTVPDSVDWPEDPDEEDTERGDPAPPAEVFEALVEIWAEILFDDYQKRHSSVAVLDSPPIIAADRKDQKLCSSPPSTPAKAPTSPA